MTPSEQSPSDQIVIRCPACGACESAEAGMVADAESIVCRECGETWPGHAEKPKRRKVARKPKPPRPEVIVAERRALVTYSDSGDNAWKAKIAGDYWPEPPRHSRLPIMAAVVASLFFLAAFFGGRQAAVAALPDLAGLYAAIGLPVNLEGFAIEDTGAERTPTFAGFKLKVHATIRNLGQSERELPPIAAVLYSDALVPSGTYGFDPPAGAIAPGESVALVMELDSAPKQAAEVVVRFRRRGETLAVAGAAETAAP